MNQKLIIGIVAIIIVAAGVGIYSSNSSKAEVVNKGNAMLKEGSVVSLEKGTQAMAQKDSWTPEQMEAMKKEEMMKKDGEAMMTKAGSYESYEPSKLAMASASHSVVLFFRASWCPTCITLDKDIKAHLKEVPASLTILDVNYDDSSELKKKYGVTYQHTFVQVDAQGKLIKKWSGSPTLASLVAEVK